jgi:hypothetical protein
MKQLMEGKVFLTSVSIFIDFTLGGDFGTGGFWLLVPVFLRPESDTICGLFAGGAGRPAGGDGLDGSSAFSFSFGFGCEDNAAGRLAGRGGLVGGSELSSLSSDLGCGGRTAGWLLGSGGLIGGSGLISFSRCLGRGGGGGSRGRLTGGGGLAGGSGLSSFSE